MILSTLANAASSRLVESNAKENQIIASQVLINTYLLHKKPVRVICNEGQDIND